MSYDLGSLLRIDLKTTKQILCFSGLISFGLILGLSWWGLNHRPYEHFDAPNFLSLREEIKKNPTHEGLVAAFRTEDLERRGSYFEAQKRLQFGGLFLFATLSVFVLALRRLAVLKERLPQPLESNQPRRNETIRKRSLMSTLCIPLPVSIGILAAFFYYGQVSIDQTEASNSEVEKTEIPDTQKWVQFRGNNGLGIAPEMESPLSWDAETGENIAWKSPIPIHGNSSPIIHGDRVFLTGADIDQRKVLCFSLETGSLLWATTIETNVVVDEEMKKEFPRSDTGFASPTPVTDGEIVVAFFGTNELVGLDFSGQQVWSKWLGKPDSAYGVASSLCYRDGKVFLQLDQGNEDDSLSALYAFNPSDGRVLWKTDREVPASWSSPIVVDVGNREELITVSDPWVISYNPVNGSEWWRASVLKGDVAPLPVFGGGLVFSVVAYSQLAAIEAGGSGDVTDTHVRWTYDDYLPDIPSPVADDQFLLLPTSEGVIQLFETQTGTILWEHLFDSEYWSSPTVIGKKVYLTDTEGKTEIFGFSNPFEELGGGQVGERVFSSPAFVESRIVIRGEEHLFCIGSNNE